VKPGKRTVAEMVVVGVLAAAALIALSLAIDWFPSSASKQAGPIDTLWYVLLGVSIPIFVLVATVVVYSVRLFRVRPGQELEDGAPIHGNTTLEVIWTALPATLIAGLVVYAYLVLHDIEKAPAKGGEMHVHVVAQQFAWQFEYRGAGGKTVKSTQLYLPKDRSVKFDINAKDVLHDFWVPNFRMKIDAVPGITTHYRITPNKLGSYPVVCAELCGLGHAFMRSTVHVLPGQQFDRWLANGGSFKPQGQGNAAAGGGAPDGKTLFANGNGTATACGSCHTLADAGTSGKIGPDLGQVLKGKDAAFIRESIVSPDKKIAKGFPAHVMPQDFSKTLSPAELDALVNYLAKVTSK
jgi:cytochrome c oxidase subunit II